MKGGLWGGLRRMVAGESLFMTRFKSRLNGQVAFAAPYPGKIKELSLAGGAAWLCQRDSFLCATAEIDVGVAFTKSSWLKGYRRACTRGRTSAFRP